MLGLRKSTIFWDKSIEKIFDIFPGMLCFDILDYIEKSLIPIRILEKIMLDIKMGLGGCTPEVADNNEVFKKTIDLQPNLISILKRTNRIETIVSFWGTPNHVDSIHNYQIKINSTFFEKGNEKIFCLEYVYADGAKLVYHRVFV